MKYILLFSMLFGNLQYVINEKGVIQFNSQFIENPTIKAGNDILTFLVSKDSIVSAKKAILSDTSFIWILHKEQGCLDFWKITAPREGNYSNRDAIFKYFETKGLTLKDVLIYNAFSIVPNKACFDKAGFSYTGIDYLFKIKKQQYKTLIDKTNGSFIKPDFYVLENNY